MTGKTSSPRGPRPRGVRPRDLLAAIGIILLVAVIAGAVWWYASRPVGKVDLRRPPADTTQTVTYAGTFPAEDRPRLLNPLGIAIEGERLYVAESDAGRISVFGLSGEEIGTIAVPVAVGSPAAYPADVAMVNAESVAVVDTAARRVVLLAADPEATAEPTIVGAADKKTAPVQPTAVAAADGELYVADGAAHDIKVYDSDGVFVRSIGADLTPALTFVGGLCVLGDGLYATDSNAGRVLVLNKSTGEQVTIFSESRALPRGIAQGPDEGLLVVDTFSRMVDITSADGVRIDGIDGNVAGEGTLGSPRDVAWYAAETRAYVTDAARGVISVYNIRIPDAATTSSASGD
ncbi:MAG: NHL repeat-containing protein [Coriobacteriia bacterium]